MGVRKVITKGREFGTLPVFQIQEFRTPDNIKRYL
jgi:hypothetical protein